MRTLRILGLGLLGMMAVLLGFEIHHWQQAARQERESRILQELTPEKLVANCGEPVSDESYSLSNVPYSREIKYQSSNYPFWVKLEFRPGDDKKWHLTHFGSSSIGVRPSDANAYLAVEEFPCMAK